MKKIQLIMFAMLVAMVPGIASGVSQALDFTGGGAAWNLTYGDPGTPNPYPVTYEMGGDPTKIGYEEDFTTTGQFWAWQEVALPAGVINVRLDALVSGWTSHSTFARVALATYNAGWLPNAGPGYYTSNDFHGYNGLVVVDAPAGFVGQ